MNAISTLVTNETAHLTIAVHRTALANQDSLVVAPSRNRLEPTLRNVLGIIDQGRQLLDLTGQHGLAVLIGADLEWAPATVNAFNHGQAILRVLGMLASCLPSECD
jgi:hypothetical protein